MRKKAPFLAASLLSCFCLAHLEAQTVVYVKHDATGANDGTSWVDAYVDLQPALQSTGSGEIWVAAGTYTPVGPGGAVSVSFQLKSGLSLLGGFAGGETSASQRDPAVNATHLSGDIGQDDVYSPVWDIHTANSDHVVVGSGCNATAVLDGFTVIAGHASFKYGAGMYNLSGSPTVRQCVFTRNMAAFSSGSGMYNMDSSPTVEYCVFIDNTVHLGSGGGIFSTGNGSPVIRDCEFIGNRCISGGSTEASGGGLAFYSASPATITRCRFENNFMSTVYSKGDAMTRGAGIHSIFTTLTVVDCEFTGNSAMAGAGIYTWDDLTVVNSLFIGNTVYSYPVTPVASQGDFGAAICSSSAQTDTTRLVQCTIAKNTGGEGAVYTYWKHNTVVENSILWGNVATGSEVTTKGAQIKGSSDILYSDVQGLLETIPGEDPPDPKDFPGSIDQDPKFVNLAGGDLHLLAGSPCIDAGNNAAVPAGIVTDLNGSPRFVDDPSTVDSGSGSAPLVDMGSYEFQVGPVAFGEGCAGSGGFVPTLGLTGNLSPGGSVTLSINQGLGGSTAMLFFGLNQAAVAMGYGCTLNLTPLLPLAIAGLPLSGVGPGNGSFVLPAVLPVGAPSATLTMQAFTIDPGVSQGFANSNGVEFSIGK